MALRRFCSDMMWLRRFWGEERRDLWRTELLGRGGRAARFEVGGGVGRGCGGISTGSSSQKLSRKSRRRSVSADEKRSSIGGRGDRGAGEVDSRDYVNRRRVVTGERGSARRFIRQSVRCLGFLATKWCKMDRGRWRRSNCSSWDRAMRWLLEQRRGREKVSVRLLTGDGRLMGSSQGAFGPAGVCGVPLRQDSLQRGAPLPKLPETGAGGVVCVS